MKFKLHKHFPGLRSFDIVIGDSDEMIGGELFLKTGPAHKSFCRREQSVLDRLLLGSVELLKEEDLIVSIWSGVTWNLIDNGLAGWGGNYPLYRPIRENNRVTGIRRVEPAWGEIERAAVLTKRNLIFVPDSELDSLLDRDRPLPPIGPKILKIVRE